MKKPSMTDTIRLEVYKKGFYGPSITVSDFNSYSIDSDLFQAADAFSFDCSDTSLPIDAGMGMRLFVNDRPEMTGVIDVIDPKAGKTDKRLSVSGRDLMGLLVDNCIEQCDDDIIDDCTIKAMAQKLLAAIPYIKSKDIIYEAGAAAFDKAVSFGQINAGETVFAVLQKYASSRGLVFWCQPNGRLVFGRPKSTGPVRYHLSRRSNKGCDNNIISGGVKRDISKAATKVIVVSQGSDAEAGPNSDTASATMPAGVFPPGFYRLAVKQINCDDVTPEHAAHLIINQMRASALQFTYMTNNHSWNGRNWTVNELCHVVDDDAYINGKSVAGDYLIYGRTFTLDKKSGAVTEVRLGLPGLVAAGGS